MSDLEVAPPGHMPVHNAGFVVVEDWAGDELSIVNAARVSFAKRSARILVPTGGNPDCPDAGYHDTHVYCPSCDFRQEPGLNDADAGLVDYLIRGRHGTPFEMVWCKWHIKAPIFVFREWHRHRMASINEMSGRYVELKPEFYLPDDEHVRVQVGKPGHYTYEPKGSEIRPDDERNLHRPGPATYGDWVRANLRGTYEIAYDQYQLLLDGGIAKELARACLPVATYSEMYWACNLRALLNFLSLRNDKRALREIRDYAEVMEAVLASKMPNVHASFVKNGRIAP